MSNDREDLEARIAAYIDGELPPAEAARLEVFLANADPKLAEQVIGMIGDRHQLRALPQARAPEDLAARIVEQVERATLLNNVEHLSTHHRPWWQSRAALAAGLLLILGGFGYFILEALHPANPAWQAALESSQHPVAVAPAAAPPPALAAAPAPKLSDASMPSDAAADNRPMMAAAGTAETLPASPAASASSESPVLLTLLAQNAEDVGRLHAALETLLADDAAANRRQAVSPRAAFAKALPEASAPTTQPVAARHDDHFQQSQSNNMADNVSALPAPPQNHVAQAAAVDQPLVYHLTLRPAQLQRLTQQFQVQTLTRGNLPFLLPPTGQLVDRDNQTAAAPSAATTAPGASSTEAAPIECVITIVPPSSTTGP